MKHFIEVQKHTGGRTITQRYPARSVGEKPTGPCAHYAVACKCGFIICGCPVPVPRGVERASPPPPADVLPEGWAGGKLPSWLGAWRYEHASGAVVVQTEEDLEDGRGWRWVEGFTPGPAPARKGHAPTRDEAMALAMMNRAKRRGRWRA